VRWAARVRNTENNVELRIGDGLWGTITGLGAYDLRFADPPEGQVGLYGVVEETSDRSPFALRLKVANGAVAEVELIVTRKPEAGTPFHSADLADKPVMNEILVEGQRRSRQDMIDIANGYFDTLQLNDGTLHTRFATDCNRVENGMQTTNHPHPLLSPISRLGCADQFRLGQYRYDDRLRDRRYPLVDEERGLVLAGAFIDHSGRLGDFTLTNGEKTTSMFRRPHSYALLELFKIKDGAIQQVEAVFFTVPYNMPSPWVHP
jgi:hypothetical protein